MAFRHLKLHNSCFDVLGCHFCWVCKACFEVYSWKVVYKQRVTAFNVVDVKILLLECKLKM